MLMIKKIRNIGSLIVLLGLVLYLNIGTVAIIMNEIDYLAFSKYLSYFGLCAFILYIGYKILEREKIKGKDIFILLLAIFAFFSYYFAFNKEEALHGVVTRNEGLFVILTYYAVYLLSTTIDSKYQKKIMYVVLGTGFFQMIVGTIQILQISNIFGYDRSMNWSTHFKFASGTLGNPNFYSTYMVLCLLYIWGMLLHSKTKKQIAIYILLFFCFLYGLVIGNTSGCILAVLLWIVITLSKKINRKNIKKVMLAIVIISVSLFLSLSILDQFINHRIRYTMNKNVEEIRELFDSGITDSTGNYRVYVWKETLKKVPKYYATGIGIDNFAHLNDGDYICTGEVDYQCFDKAHNEYLQILITEGIFTLVVYISFLTFVFYEFIHTKGKKDSHKIGIMYAVIGYLIQAFFNISVITVAPIFYMLMGFMNSKCDGVEVLVDEK